LYHFTPPKVIEAEVFMRLPDHLRRDKAADLTPWSRQQHPGVPVAAFLEGPSFDTAGNLYCVDIAHGRIFRTNPDGVVSVVTEYDGEPNGLKIHRDGRIFIADYKNGIVNVDPATGKVTPVLERARLERFRGVNDLVSASNGDLYFTDQGQTGMHDPNGCVYRLRANGQVDRILDNVPSLNGLVLNVHEKVLYLAVTRQNCVWRVRLLPDGTATKVGVFVRLSVGLAGPDGRALNEEDGLTIAHAGYGVVWICNRLGDPRHRRAFARRSLYKQGCLWRRGPPRSLHHRILQRNYTASPRRCSGPSGVFPHVSASTNGLTLSPLLVLDGCLLDFVEFLEPDEFFDLLPGIDVVLIGHAGVVPSALNFLQRLLGEMEAHQEISDRVDAGLVAHIGELRRARQRTIVAIAAAHHIDQRNVGLLRSFFHLFIVARKEQPHVRADIGGHVDARDRFIQSLEPAGVAACNDDKISIDLVASTACEFDLVDEFVASHRMRNIFVIVRALWVELIFDVNSSDAGANEFSHRAHGVKRFAETGSAVGNGRDFHRIGDIGGHANLLVHSEKRLGCAA
jgi:gluconolactonase